MSLQPSTLFYIRSIQGWVERLLTRLTWLALLVVDEAAEVGAEKPVAPSAGLRLALAYLHSIADGPIFALPSRRHIFDEFWRNVTAELEGGNPHSARYARHCQINSCREQIGRQIGQTALLFNAVRDFRKREAAGDARDRLAAEVRQFMHVEEERKLDKRRYYWQPPPKPK